MGICCYLCRNGSVIETAIYIVTLCTYAQHGYAFGHVSLCIIIYNIKHILKLKKFFGKCRDDLLVKKVK